MKRVLVVDDNADLAELLSEVLVDEGHEVVTAGDGLEAVAQLDAGFTPHVAIVDSRMPGLDGHGLLLHMRAAGLTTHVVILTAFPSRREAALFKQEGADQVLSKPISMVTLCDIVAEQVTV